MELLRRVFFGSFFLLLVTASLVWAEDDPPDRVARLQYMTGSVSIQPRGSEDWVAGSLNRPLTTSDNLWSDRDSRAELNLGTGILRVDDETSLTLTNVSDNTVQVQLHQGTLNLRVRRLYRGEIYEVDTPNIAFTVQKSGEYRFDVAPSGDVTLVTVWKGEGDATGDGPAVRVRGHQRARFTGGTSLAHELYEAPPYDGFDDWCRVRDRREDHGVSARYVSPGVIGYEDLDEYGGWQVVPTYGAVWVPTAVVTGWAPYRYGHWVWISPWGWTWVDDAAWGFAPFHYGRWVYVGNYWAWAPGPIYVRPVYAPALVAWFGGGGFGVGIAFGGGYGWCPLSYGEPFIPWYGGSRRYFQRVNITNTRITNITNITNNYYNDGSGRRLVKAYQYANLKTPGAVTAVSQHTIVDSMPVARTAIAVSPKQAQEWSKGSPGSRVDLTPTRESRLGVNRGMPAAAPPKAVFTRPVVSKIAPPAERPRMDRSEGRPNGNAPHAPQAEIAEKEPVAPSPASGRLVPRPPQRAENPKVGAEMPRAVPKPPVTDISERRPQEPGAVPAVARPAEANRAAENKPAYSASPAMRPVPRPPSGVNTPSQPDTERPATPHSPEAKHVSPGEAGSDRGPYSSSPVRSIPHPPASGTSPSSPDTEQRAPRPQRGSIAEAPRPTGPVAAPPSSSGADQHRYAPPSSSPGDSHPGAAPRSGGEPPRTSPPAPSHSAPQGAPQSAPAPSNHSTPSSNPSPSPTPRSPGGR